MIGLVVLFCLLKYFQCITYKGFINLVFCILMETVSVNKSYFCICLTIRFVLPCYQQQM